MDYYIMLLNLLIKEPIFWIEIIAFITVMFFILKWGFKMRKEQNKETKLLHECLNIAHEYETALINGNDYMKKEVNKMHKDLKDRNIT